MSLLANENRYIYGQYLDSENQNYHIVRSKSNGNATCTKLQNHTICSEEITFDMLENKDCATSTLMRKTGYELGRQMCGTCISHLFADLSEDELKQLGEK